LFVYGTLQFDHREFNVDVSEDIFEIIQVTVKEKLINDVLRIHD